MKRVILGKRKSDPLVVREGIEDIRNAIRLANEKGEKFLLAKKNLRSAGSVLLEMATQQTREQH